MGEVRGGEVFQRQCEKTDVVGTAYDQADTEKSFGQRQNDR